MSKHKKLYPIDPRDFTLSDTSIPRLINCFLLVSFLSIAMLLQAFFLSIIIAKIRKILWELTSFLGLLFQTNKKQRLPTLDWEITRTALYHIEWQVLDFCSVSQQEYTSCKRNGLRLTEIRYTRGDMRVSCIYLYRMGTQTCVCAGLCAG